MLASGISYQKHPFLFSVQVLSVAGHRQAWSLPNLLLLSKSHLQAPGRFMGFKAVPKSAVLGLPPVATPSLIGDCSQGICRSSNTLSTPSSVVSCPAVPQLAWSTISAGELSVVLVIMTHASGVTAVGMTTLRQFMGRSALDIPSVVASTRNKVTTITMSNLL